MSGARGASAGVKRWAKQTTSALADPSQATFARPPTPDPWLLALAAVLVFAALLRFWNLGRDGFGYPYYAAAARSMSENARLFFFVAFDGAGAVAVDKPPLALWIQSASVRAFGWHPLSLLVPGAIAGVGTVALLYGAVRQTHGHRAGLWAALLLAITPASVAVDRLNLPDPFLHLLLVGAAWAAVFAAQTGRLGPLALTALLVGAGFHAKMGSALAPVPGFALAYLAGGIKAEPRVWLVRLRRLAITGLILVPACLWWTWIVDATPPHSRPYVAGSANNTASGLLRGYNGANRVTGRGPYQITPEVARRVMAQNPLPFAFARRGFSHPLDGGTPGGFRLLLPPLAPLIGWGYPLALAGLMLLAAHSLGRGRGQAQAPARLALLVWGCWAFALVLVFSVARGTFHPYYVAFLAPPLAALGGIGVNALWECWTRHGKTGAHRFVPLALPLAVLVCAAWQTGIVRRYTDWAVWLIPLVLLGAGTASALLTALWAERETGAAGDNRTDWAKLAALGGASALLTAPLAWSLTPARGKNSPILPTAGPEVMAGYVAPGAPPLPVTRALAQYLTGQHKGERFLLATGTTFVASPLIIETGRPVLALGGFTGGDPIVTPSALARLVQDNQVRFVLSVRFEVAGSPENLPALMKWAEAHGRVVPQSEWLGDVPAKAKKAASTWVLYDCRPKEQNAVL